VRRALLAKGGQERLVSALHRLGPLSIVALLLTLVLLFGFQGEQILAQPLVIALLAVAAAIALFGIGSGAALATVVGVLIEVPVMLTIVRIVNRTKNWYEAPQRDAARSRP
jgi:arsenite transporter